MKYGGVLTKVPQRGESFCCCDQCQTVWQDDIPMMGVMACPNKCGSSLTRGITREQARDKVDDSHKELLS